MLDKGKELSKRRGEIINSLTNPLKHDKSHFSYIIHATHPDDKFIDKLNRMMNDGNYYFSASIISDKHCRTYAPFTGLILGVNKDDIIIAQPGDIGTPFNLKDRVWYAKTNNGKVMPLVELLIAPGYNELLIRGGRSKLFGIFYLSGNEFVKADAVKLKSLIKEAFNIDLPLIELSNTPHSSESKNFNQVFFVCDGFSVNNYKLIQEGMDAKRIYPNARKAVLDFNKNVVRKHFKRMVKSNSISKKEYKELINKLKSEP